MKICPICKKEFEPKREQQKYCSQECGNKSRRKFNKPQYCELCGKELTYKQKKARQRFCSNSCSMKHSKATFNYKPMEYTSEIRKKLSDSMKKNWLNKSFRDNNYKRMTENNPVYMDGVVEKIINTQNKNGTMNTKNRYKYGNGKISDAEQIALDILEPLNFIYNYAISIKDLRIAYPEKRFARNYKPDFTNLKYKIAIEIDGNSHNRPNAKLLDKKKEFALNYYGYKVYRFKNTYVINETKRFKKDIERIIKECMEN